jgi:hypothetical protein
MLNQFCLVGRVYNINAIENKITLKIPRSSKNEFGEYENDYIKVSLPNNSDISLLKENDIVGIKGRLQEKELGDLEVIGEKISYLSSSN